MGTTMKKALFLALAVTCFVPASCSNSPTGTPAASSDAHVRQVLVEDQGLFTDLGLEAVCFEVQGRQDQKITVWLETYVNGQLADHLTFGQFFIPGTGGVVKQKFRFTRLRDPREAEGGRDRVALRLCSSSLQMQPIWISNPMASMRSVSQSFSSVDNLSAGETYTVWRLVATDGDNYRVGTPDADMTNPMVMYIKCRMDYPAMQRQASESGAFSGLPPDTR